MRCLCEWHLSLSRARACAFLTGNCLTFEKTYIFSVFISRKAEKPPNSLSPTRQKKNEIKHVRVNCRGVDEQRERVRAFQFTTFLFSTTALVAKEPCSSRRRTHESTTTKIRVLEEDRRRRFFSLGVVFVRGRRRRRRREKQQHRAERSRRQRATTQSPGRRVAPTARPRSRR